jgi:cholesterol transport system auxiliary component
LNKLAPVLLLMLGACTLGPRVKDVPATYDLGPLRSFSNDQPRIHRSLLVYDVAAPEWLATSDIIYRLNYRDAARQQTYVKSQWVAAPALLLTQRLRERLAAATDGGVLGTADAARADYAVRMELDEFSHIFDSAAASHATVAARVTVVNLAQHTLVGQKSFAVERPALSADAQGAVQALAEGSDQLLASATAWIAAILEQEKK